MDLLDLLEELEAAKARDKCVDSYMDFVREMWSAFIHGDHHKIMAEAFEKVARGDLKRLIINMPPRHTKSEFASYLLPAWFLGRYPDKKIIQTAHTAELAVGFGRRSETWLIVQIIGVYSLISVCTQIVKPRGVGIRTKAVKTLRLVLVVRLRVKVQTF